MHEEKDRLLALLKKQAFRRGKVTLASGKVSDFYIDAKQVTLAPEGMYLTAKIMLDMLKSVKFDALGGLTIGADPIVAAIGVVSHLEGRGIQTFIVRKEAKKHGMQKSIEGPALKPGSKVVIVEDVMTSGGSALKAIEAVEAAKCKVVKVIALVDRMDGAKETLESKNYEVISVFNKNDFIK